MKLKHQMWKINQLKPYDRNARNHPAEQVKTLAKSIQEFGFTAPLLVSADGEVIAGHGRLLAAEYLGLDRVPVLIADHLTPDQRQAYRIADNRIAELSTWDRAALRMEMQELNAKLPGLDALKSIGFSKKQMARLMPELRAGDDKPAPEPKKKTVAKPGEIWLLGRHRLACGDACDVALVKALLDGAQPRLMVTDPPYGVNYDPNWRPGVARTDQVPNDTRADWREAWALFPGDVAYVWHSGLKSAVVLDSILAAGMEPRAQIIWSKENLRIGRGHYHWMHEPCLYAVRKGGKAEWQGGRKQTTVWNIPGTTGSGTGGKHGTQKPMECMERPIRNHGGNVYDPFVGSGTTLIAAERQERDCFAIDIDPAYCDVVIERWQNLTGGKARKL